MDKFSVCHERKFHNLTATQPKMHLLDEPSGFVSAIAKDNLGHQMRYSVEVLERRLLAEGHPHVLQLACSGDPRDPERWELYADGECVASGNGEFARECFRKAPEEFLGLLAEAVAGAGLPSMSDKDYRLLSMARKISSVTSGTLLEK